MTTITRWRGDDWTWTVAVNDPDVWGPLTGTTTSKIRRNTESTAAAATWTVTVDNAALRLVTLTCAAAVTALIEPGIYVFDVQNIDGTGKTHTFGAAGVEPITLIVKGDTTR